MTSGTGQIESLTSLLSELERFVKWLEAERGLAFHNRLVVTLDRRGTRRNLLGHFVRKQWSHKEGESAHEISIVTEALSRPPMDTLTTLAHECVHLHNQDAGVKDCSSSGRHNKKFKAQGETFGMVVEMDGSRGWSKTTLTPEFEKAIESSFQPDYQAFQLFRETFPTTRAVAPTKNRKWSCACSPPINLRVAVHLYATCDICNAKFKLQD